MKIAVIGAGPAGLCALKTCLDENFNCDVFEKSGVIGGVWNYNEKIGIDEFGIPIHNSVYEELRTNLPKELMQFENFPFKGPLSFVYPPDVINYVNKYADAFNLLPHIQFHKNVEEIRPLPNNRWKIIIRDLKPMKQELIICEYDAVVICVGNFNKPFIPSFKGLDKFKGSIRHSITYRKADLYKNGKVLLVGSGPSGSDITRQLSKVAEKVILSHRSPLENNITFSENVKTKPEIAEFRENTVLFIDGTEEDITDVLLCTGYLFDYPFLTNECGIEVEDNYVKYLYKQIINAKHPTMAILGVPHTTFLFIMFGIQIRFFIAYLKGQFTASKETMIDDAILFQKRQKEKGVSLSRVNHEYYDDLSETAKIPNLPSVCQKLFDHVEDIGILKFQENYKILNDQEFIIV
ncbi:unnamed protein product [Psylliodes chrysocephalus]|uniref:Flavin-containing monooxygenase n=1 Tax=Psylliodes chrysocephalus TaxID=3402493 RepID=A0A9P0D5I2_9CUCU|nr:unnamed protein product [Psylliodes chrysocephala]